MPEREDPDLISPQTVVSLPAEIDIANARRIRGVLMGAAAHGVKTVVADMSRTVFCDCEGAYSLAQAYTQLAAKGVDLRLVTPAEAVRRVFAMLTLDKVVPLYDSLDDAATVEPAAEDGTGPAAA
jgi:anti-sigma B factor antagonist